MPKVLLALYQRMNILDCSSVAVSYTHLDVYKRQLIIFVEQVGYFTTNCQVRGDRIRHRKIPHAHTAHFNGLIRIR